MGGMRLREVPCGREGKREVCVWSLWEGGVACERGKSVNGK